jgi:hypothetical protein
VFEERPKQETEQVEEHLGPGGVWDGILQLTAEAIRHLRRASLEVFTIATESGVIVVGTP